MDQLNPIKITINEWQETVEQLSEWFEKRDKEKVSEPMKYYTERFIQALYDLNGKERSDDLSSLTYKPINIEERLSFIKKRPHLYHAFVQLKECYIELEKIYEKLKIKQNLYK